jgi:hypothetical protein
MLARPNPGGLNIPLADQPRTLQRVRFSSRYSAATQPGRWGSVVRSIVRPPHLKDGPRTGVYRHGFPTTDRRIKGRISRADVADFMLKQLVDDTYLHQTPGVSY